MLHTSNIPAPLLNTVMDRLTDHTLPLLESCSFFSCTSETQLAEALSSDHRYFYDVPLTESLIPSAIHLDHGFDASITLSFTSQTVYRLLLSRAITHMLQQRFSLSTLLANNIEIALHEALVNALLHGNLEMDSTFLDMKGMSAYYRAIEEKLSQPDFRQRRLTLYISRKNLHLHLTIMDEGKGFNTHHTLTHHTAANHPATQPRGMGITLMQCCSDHLHYEEDGRSVTLSFALQDHITEPPATEQPTTASPFATSRVLIIDDMDYNRQIIRDILESDGYHQIEEAEHGQQALEMLEHFTPDLVITDLIMPVMDGFEFCQKFRDIPRHANTTIIAQASMNDFSERFRIFEAGANDLVLKPINHQELLLRIEMHLERAHAFNELFHYRQRLKQEMQAARDMHQSLIPSGKHLRRILDNQHIHVSSYFEPSSEIGGDIWGAIPLSDQLLAIYSCDFTGHGVGAAINTFRFHTLINTLKEETDQPTALMNELNQRMKPLLPVEQFATMFYGVIDRQNNQLHYAAAASPPPFIYEAQQQSIRTLDSSGIPLGITYDATYETQTTAFHAGDTLFLYSDALIETRIPPHQHTLGEQDITQSLQQHLTNPLDNAHQLVIHELLQKLEILSGNYVEDDLTLILLTRQD